MKDLVEEMQAFLGLNSETKDDESESPDTSGDLEKIGHLNDVCHENKVLNRCGLGLSEEEAYLVYTSLKTFNKEKRATNTRFWGKIFGLHRDYYVIETETENEETDSEERTGLEVKTKCSTPTTKKEKASTRRSTGSALKSPIPRPGSSCRW